MLLGLGTAFPDVWVEQAVASSEAARLNAFASDDAQRLSRGVYPRCGVRGRGVAGGSPDDPCPVLRQPRDATDRGPTTAERIAAYASAAPPMAEAAARRALAESGLAPARVGHLVVASCTGFSAPGVDVQLIDRLGLPRTVRRTSVGFMGCHAAINALRVAGAIAGAEPEAVVLVVCVEVCSIHFRYHPSPDQVVSNALFADGAGAAVVAGAGVPGPRLARLGPSASLVLPGTADRMTWSIGDHGFEMTLSPEVPRLIETSACPWLMGWLAECGCPAMRVAGWAVHPGGPRILDAVQRGMGLGADALEAARGVLADHGNMSSPTVLAIVDRLRGGSGAVPAPAALVAFGPGLAAEAMLLQAP